MKSKSCLLAILALSLVGPGLCRDGGFESIVWKKQIPWMLLSGGIWVGSRLLKDQLVVPFCPCGRGPSNFLDRGIAGRRDDGMAKISDVGLVISMGAPLAIQILRGVHHRRRPNHVVQDSFWVAQTLVFNGALNEIVKLAAQRPRPLIHGLAQDSPALREPENYLSFYSSHTSRIFALGISSARLYSLRNPESRVRGVFYAGVAVLGLGMGTLRVLAGRHYPTDVLAGAMLGTLAGLVVPHLLAKDIFPIVNWKRKQILLTVRI